MYILQTKNAYTRLATDVTVLWFSYIVFIDCDTVFVIHIPYINNSCGRKKGLRTSPSAWSEYVNVPAQLLVQNSLHLGACFLDPGGHQKPPQVPNPTREDVKFAVVEIYVPQTTVDTLQPSVHSDSSWHRLQSLRRDPRPASVPD